MQPTQFPLPSHIRLGPHETVAETFMFCGTPLLHVSSVHGLLSPGTSLLSFTVATAPLEHTSFLQSPGASETVIPSFRGADEHVPEAQVKVLHCVSVPQLPLVTHLTHAGAVALPLHIEPPP